MRGLAVLLLVVSACQDDFTIAQPDAAPDVAEADANFDAPMIDVPTDAPNTDDVMTLADATVDSAVDALAMSDVGIDAARPMNAIRLLPHQLRLLDGFYEMNVLIAVLSGAPVATSPANMFLRFDGGAEVPGVAFDRPAANAKCSESLRVTDATGLLCRVSFPALAGVGVPVELVFVPEGRRITTPVATCSAGAIIGRCDEELLCIGGNCLDACTSDTPDGWCFLQEECHEGACVADCSVFSPDGFCNSGTCVEGACQL